MQTSIPDRQPLLELRNVAFRYPSMPNESLVIDDFDFRLAAGEVVHITGRNGSGKTTLLKLITNELTPTRGDRVERKSSLRAVYLDQYTGDFLGEALTVREQLAMSLPNSLALRTVKPCTVDPKIKTLLQTYGVGLEGKLDAFTSELSGGQRQIVSLLTVLQDKVDILALDEFTAHMDPASARLSWRCVEELIREKSTAVVYVNQSAEGGFSNEKELRI